MVHDTLVFTANPLTRAVPQDSDPDWLTASLNDLRGRYLILRDLEVLVTRGKRPKLVWCSLNQLPVLDSGPILLGVDAGVPHFAVALDSEPVEGIAPNMEYVDVRSVSSLLTIGEAAIVAQARSMAAWHARSRICSNCGKSTISIEGGGRRECKACNERYYPRVDPSIIVLVEREDHILLVGRVGGPDRRRSCVAGFVEPGESIEEAVGREVFEETGVHINQVQYRYSQPWPFPSVLMIGWRALASSSDISVDGVEIGHADWYGRAQVLDALAGKSDELVVPEPIAIAHHLIRDWATLVQ